MKNIAGTLKSKVEELIKEKKIPHHFYNWSNPGDKLIEALDKMNQGQSVNAILKSEAMVDYNKNVIFFLNKEDDYNLNKLFSEYNIN